MNRSVRTTCSALFVYLTVTLLVSIPNIARPSTVVFAKQYSSRYIQLDRELKSHKGFKRKGSSQQEYKQWLKKIVHDEDDSDRGTSNKTSGKGGTIKSDSKGKGGGMMSKGMMGSGKGTSSKLPKVCKGFDFEQDFGKGKGKKGKGFGMGKGKGSNEMEGCRRNVYKKARRIPEISIFVGLLEQAGLDEILTCNGPFTVLAPSNTAFMNNSIVTNYLSDVANADELQDVLLYHILPGLGYVEDFRNGSVETLLQYANINVTIDPVRFNDDAMIVEGDFKACNGVIHIIDDILLPPGTHENNTYGAQSICCLLFVPHVSVYHTNF